MYSSISKNDVSATLCVCLAMKPAEVKTCLEVIVKYATAASEETSSALTLSSQLSCDCVMEHKPGDDRADIGRLRLRRKICMCSELHSASQQAIDVKISAALSQSCHGYEDTSIA